MKLPQLVVAFAVSVAIVMSCHKSNNTITAPASLNVVNAIPALNGQLILTVVGTSDSTQYFNVPRIYYGHTQLFSPVSGTNAIYVVQGYDTTNPKQRLFNGTLNLASGGMFSFFLSGDTTKIDTLFVQDNIPYHPDSTTGVRFVNLSAGSQPISVTLLGKDPTQTEFIGLGYRQISSFKSYTANSSVAGKNYTFVIRDQTTGDSLTQFTWNYPVFRNNTLVISGSEDPASSTPLQVFAVNHY